MSFKVVWAERTEEQVAEIWVGAKASERQRITEALDEIESWLADDPLGVSESRDDEQLRVVFNDPVAVLLAKIEQERPDYSKLEVPFTDEEIEAARKGPAGPIKYLLQRFREMQESGQASC